MTQKLLSTATLQVFSSLWAEAQLPWMVPQ
jgi:hypothetical protein